MDLSKVNNTVGSECKDLAERLGELGGRGGGENARAQGWGGELRTAVLRACHGCCTWQFTAAHNQAS